jgi:hypothetical protein
MTVFSFRAHGWVEGGSSESQTWTVYSSKPIVRSERTGVTVSVFIFSGDASEEPNGTNCTF